MIRTIDEDTFYLPETAAEWETLKSWLIKKGLKDEPETWTFVLSQLQGVKMPELTTTFSNIIAHYKRWKIAKILQDEKIVYLEQLQRKLEEAVAAEAKKDEGTSPQEEDWTHPVDVPGGTHSSESEVSVMQRATEGLVSEAPAAGI